MKTFEDFLIGGFTLGVLVFVLYVYIETQTRRPQLVKRFWTVFEYAAGGAFMVVLATVLGGVLRRHFGW